MKNKNYKHGETAPSGATALSGSHVVSIKYRQSANQREGVE